MRKVIVDTSWLIDYLRTKDRRRNKYSNEVDKGSSLYISIITHTELHSGKSIWQDNEAKLKLEKLLRNITIIALDENISVNAGKIRALYDLQIEDAVIAATALISNLPLLTLNLKDFKKVKTLKLV